MPACHDARLHWATLTATLSLNGSKNHQSIDVRGGLRSYELNGVLGCLLMLYLWTVSTQMSKVLSSKQLCVDNAPTCHLRGTSPFLTSPFLTRQTSIYLCREGDHRLHLWEPIAFGKCIQVDESNSIQVDIRKLYSFQRDSSYVGGEGREACRHIQRMDPCKSSETRWDKTRCT